MFKKILKLLESEDVDLSDADRASLAAKLLNDMAEPGRHHFEVFFEKLDADVHTELCGVAAEEDERDEPEADEE